VVSGTACPGSRRGLPPGVTVFANATINKTTSISLHRTTSAKTRATAKLRQHAHTAER